MGEPLFSNRSISNSGISASAVALSLVLIVRAGGGRQESFAVNCPYLECRYMRERLIAFKLIICVPVFSGKISITSSYTYSRLEKEE